MCWEDNHIHQTTLEHKHNTALKVLMGGHHLIKLDQYGAGEDNLTSKATTFVAACYGSKVDIIIIHDYSPLPGVEV